MSPLGDSVYHGLVGGTIRYTGHAPEGRASPAVGPTPRHSVRPYSHGGDGGIAATIRAGVPRPMESAAPRPRWLGVPLTDERRRAVAAYVHSLSPPATAPAGPV